MDSEEGDSLEHWFGNCNSNPLESERGASSGEVLAGINVGTPAATV